MSADPSFHDALAWLLGPTPPTPEQPTVADWWPRWQALTAACPGASPLALALRGGALADRIGWAFAAGYQAALRALDPTLAWSRLAALCVTETGGNRPRDVHTRLDPTPDGGWRLTGAKRWTTLGPQGSVLLVVGRLPASGSDDGAAAARPRLRVARVPVPADGLVIDPMPATPFVPEVPHACLQLDGVVVPGDALLPGDGYDAVVKPFRSLEDLYVTAAVVAHLLRQARARDWPTDLCTRAAAVLAGLSALADAPRGAPATHVALEGAMLAAHGLFDEAGNRWAQTPGDPAAVRWVRDRPLLGVARGARALRLARAWERLNP